jgi:SprT-like family
MTPNAPRPRMIRAHNPRMRARALQTKARAQGALQTAYEFFNRQLFCGQLPDCLITLPYRHKRLYGYFWRSRFTSLEGQERRTDEIALDPRRFTAGIEDVLSTLAHGMVHLWQHHFGTPTRGGYHNCEWAAKMKEIGLYPSATGAAGGKETGRHMSHYVIAGGAFATACVALVSEGFKLALGEIADAVRTMDAGDRPNRRRVKYTCPNCEAKAWGKPDLALICGGCKTAFVVATFDYIADAR